MTNEGFNPSSAGASAAITLNVLPVDGISILSRYKVSRSDRSGSISTILFTPLNTILACSLPEATAYTSPPPGPVTKFQRANPDSNVLLAFLRAIPIKACRCLYRPSARLASNARINCFCHGRRMMCSPTLPPILSFVTRQNVSMNSIASSPEPCARSIFVVGVSTAAGQPRVLTSCPSTCVPSWLQRSRPASRTASAAAARAA